MLSHFAPTAELTATQLSFFIRHLFHFLSDEEKKVVKSLGYKVLYDLQAGMISSSSVLVASIMLQNLQGLHFGMFSVIKRC